MSQRIPGSSKGRGGKKNRKHGRNEKWCQGYRLRGQREKNKRRRLLSHVRRFPNDAQALERLNEIGKGMGRNSTNSR